METDLDIAEKQKRTENALQTKSIRIVKFFLSLLSAWPGDEMGYPLHWLAKCYRYYLPMQCFVEWVGEIHYMTTYELDYLHFGDAMSAWLLTSVELIHRVVEKASYYLALYMTCTTMLACLLFNLSPLYINYVNGIFSADKQNITSFELALYYSSPFFNPFENFKFVTFLSLIFTCICGISVTCMDLLVTLMTFNIIGHIYILRKNLESISGPGRTENLQFERKNRSITVQYEVYSKEENENISFILKDCVNHHRFIVRFTDKMSSFFGHMLVLNYAYELVTCCILLLESTEGDLFTKVRFGLLTYCVFSQLIQISVTFEILLTMSEKLPDSLYSIPWECMDIRNQRTVCILLQRVQRVIQVTAMGMTNIGVTTMAQILKTTITYFVFLRSLNK